MSRPATRTLLARFMAVGGCGFAIDVLSFQLIFSAGGGLILSRVLSATVAITLTWYLNRHLVFETHGVNRKGPEYGRYLGVQTIGLAVNFGVYFIALQLIPSLRSIPVIALAAGAAAALTFNFLGARLWAFRLDKSRSPRTESHGPG